MECLNGPTVEPGSTTSLAMSDNELPEPPGYETVRLCLYGEMEEARLDFVPGELHLGNIRIGEAIYRELTILNPSKSTLLVYKFVPNAAARCAPPAGQLEPLRSVQVLITITGNYNVKIPVKLCFDVVVESCNLTNLSISNVKTKTCCIFAWYNLTLPLPNEKSIKGSTVIHDGIFVKQATSQSVQQKLQCQTLSDVKMKLCINSHNKKSKKFLHSQTKLEYEHVLTPHGARFKLHHRLYWLNYIRLERTLQEKMSMKRHVAGCIPDNAINCRDFLTVKLPKIKEQSIANKMLGEATAFKVVTKARTDMLLPLSPLQIYNVKIGPSVLAYGMVALKSTNYRTLHTENLNDFPVLLRLASLVSKSIRFPNGNLIILQPGAQITRIVEYQAQKIGKFNTYINYIINDNHSFAMTITAIVVFKSLNINGREITFGNQYLPQEAYQPLASVIEIKNKLDAVTSFTWDLRSNASFVINPMSGEVRGNRTLFAEVSYEPIASMTNNAEAGLVSESGTWVNLKLNAILKKPKVAFINSTLNLDKIPLNTMTTAIGVLHNAEFRDVMFQVEASSLIYGCEVHPQYGTIPPRGIITLEVRLKFDACFKFSITINIIVQKCLTLKLILRGEVAYPMLKLSPEDIYVNRISVDSIATHLLAASNIGESVIKLQFPLEEYPEYCASLSPDRRDPGLDGEGLTILPGITVSVYLHFMPIDLASYAFYLPIVVNEILGPVLVENPKSNKPSHFLKARERNYICLPGIEMTELPHIIPKIFINCTVSGHIISFNKHLFHFDVVSNKVKDELRVFNATCEEVSFIIRIDDFIEPNSPFSMTWLSGVKPAITAIAMECTLRLGEDIRFLIEFKPVEQGKYEIEAPIFVRGELGGNMFNSLLIVGINFASCIVCDKTELYFAPVWLGVQAQQKLTLKVDHCHGNSIAIEAAVVKPDKFGGTYSDNCIQVRFPASNVVTNLSSAEELKILVLFQSEFPVAFSTRIDFYIMGVVTFSINICAIADNCILTTYGFLRGSADLDRMTRLQESISIPSITSLGQGSSPLTKQEMQTPSKRVGRTPRRLNVHPSVSGGSQKSCKVLSVKLKPGQIEWEEYENINYEDSEGVSLNSKVLDVLPQVSWPNSKFSGALYPYFPPTIKSSVPENDMQRTITAAEQWMFSGGFKFNFYPSILDGITGVFSGICTITTAFSDHQSTHTVNQSFLDLIVLLTGSDVLKYIGHISSIPENPMERVNYVLKLYGNVLEFLAIQGAFLPHVRTQFLLSYNDYLLYHAQGRPVMKGRSSLEIDNVLWHDRMSKEVFESRSKQCWLDVALQSFKALVLKRVSFKNLQDNANSPCLERNKPTSTPSSATSAFSIQLSTAKKGTMQFTMEETLLLNWLQHHFEKELLMGWMKDDRTIHNPHEKRDTLETRTVSNFDSDLADSLVLIALTTAHCPYLIDDHFRNIYISPRNQEEVYHNAVCLTAAWRKVRLGFMITPAQIARPNCVQMVMLVTHLFFNLPTFLPNAKIQFCSPLTGTVTRQISFQNTTDFPVSYAVEFIGNEMNLFSTVIQKSVIYVSAHDTGILKIRYHAKKIADTEAYIILCGSSVAPNFTSNYVFILECRTSYLSVTNRYETKEILYKVCEKTFNVSVPFKEAAEYDISLTEEEPTVPTSLKLNRWADLKNRKIPRRLFLNQQTIIVLDNSYQADLSITMACIAPTKRSFWIVFKSKIGDFIIQIDSIAKNTMPDYISVEWERKICICPDLIKGASSICPLNIKIPIPARNVQLWACINQMFQKTLGPKERLFWSRHLDTDIGLRLIHWLMGDYHDSSAKEFMHIFNTSVSYRVKTVNTKNLIVPSHVLIHDVRLREKEIHIPVHILETTPQAYTTIIQLSSPDGMEHRAYKIDFLCKVPIIRPPVTVHVDNHKNRNKALLAVE